MNENKKENKPEYYFCPEKNCNEIPKIINIDSDSGNILFNCNKHGDKEINVIEYLNILQNKKEAKPKGNSNPETINSDEIKKIKNALDDKMNNLNKNKVFYQSILDMQTEFPYNYFHNKNVIDIAEYIKEGNSRSLRDYKINYEEIYKNKENQEKNIESLKKNYKIIVNYDKEHKGVLQQWAEFQNKNLKDSGFKLISQIVFKNLIILNLSNNEIKDISPLNEMLLPNLEIIDLSRNKIENIEPVANLKSKKLKEIFLHHNDIKDISPFKDSKFPELEILRIECNKNLNKDDEKYKNIKKNFKNQIIYEEQTFEKFNANYNCNISQEDKKIELRNKKEKGGDKMIKDLYLTFTNNYEKIGTNELLLSNNEIKDPSKLNRIPFQNIKVLELSSNKITNLNFLKEMNLKNLEELYLESNNINNFNLLTTINLKELTRLKITNNIGSNNEKTNRVIEKLKEENLNLNVE